MVTIPQGRFTMGDPSDADARPVRTISLPAFRIDRLPVTNAAYLAFVQATGAHAPRAWAKKMGRQEAEALYHAIQNTKIPPPATDCICPIGEDLILKGLHQVVPGEFYAAATRPPAVDP